MLKSFQEVQSYRFADSPVQRRVDVLLLDLPFHYHHPHPATTEFRGDGLTLERKKKLPIWRCHERENN